MDGLRGYVQFNAHTHAQTYTHTNAHIERRKQTHSGNGDGNENGDKNRGKGGGGGELGNLRSEIRFGSEDAREGSTPTGIQQKPQPQDPTSK